MSTSRQKKMPILLSDRYRSFLRQKGKSWQKHHAKVCSQRRRTIVQMDQLGIRTVDDLMQHLPTLPLRLQRGGIDLFMILGIRAAIPVLFEVWNKPALRSLSAVAIAILKPGKKVRQHLLDIARRELRSQSPDPTLLSAVFEALCTPENSAEAEMLVCIFERSDLPGWVRGDAADKLGCAPSISDRRTGHFRRAKETAIAGLGDPSLEVQFWSMYLIGSMCSGPRHTPRSNEAHFATALPKLRQIAKHDHRLAPGYWWPMSAEAEDIIGCIEKGQWPQPDAGERWARNSKRGEMEKR